MDGVQDHVDYNYGYGTDYNRNGVPDHQEVYVYGAHSDDQNRNGVPDHHE
jgi:hypothetical protein